MKLLDIFDYDRHDRSSRSFKKLTERFDNSDWLIKNIYNSIRVHIGKKYDPQLFYTGILKNIIQSLEFKNLFNDVKTIPVIPVVEIIDTNDCNIVKSASVKFITSNSVFRYIKWNEKYVSIQLKLVVSSDKPKNLQLLCLELDSILGHEITHLIQRLHRLKDEHYIPGPLKKIVRRLQKKDADEELRNTVHYTNVYRLGNTDIDREIQYYLNHGELGAYAYTVAVRLSLIYGVDSIKILKLLYRDIWNGKSQIVKNKIDSTVVNILNKYSTLLKYAEHISSPTLIKSGQSRRLYDKIFKEIYRILKQRIDSTKETK